MLSDGEEFGIDLSDVHWHCTVCDWRIRTRQRPGTFNPGCREKGGVEPVRARAETFAHFGKSNLATA